MVNYTILAGGYSAFIATYVFDSANNVLSLVGQSQTGGNPSWISLHPVNKSILYAVNENAPGALQSFVIGNDGLLSEPISTVSTQGDSPAFAVPLSTGQVAVMNYNTGNGRIIPTTSDPLFFDESSAPLIAFPAAVSHPHMVVENGDELLVPDLGADEVWRLRQTSPDAPGTWEIQGSVQQTLGSGPRHIALADGYLYTLHELSSTLTSQQLPTTPDGVSLFVANLSIVPPDPVEGAVFAAAEILIPAVSEGFNGTFIFTSNRNTGVQDPRGDAITIFNRGPEGELDIAGYVFTGLDQIRGVQFFGENDRFLIASGVAGEAGVLVFERTGNGGNLALLTSNTEISTRTSFVSI